MIFQYNLMVKQMKWLKIDYKRINKQKISIAIGLILAIFLGYILYKNMDNSSLITWISNIKVNLEGKHIQFLANHLLVLALLIFSAFLLIETITFRIYLILELACVSYGLLLFISVFKLPGLIYGVLYMILTKFIYLLALSIIFKKIKILRRSIITNQIDPKFKQNYYGVLLAIAIVILNDLFLFWLGSFIMLKLSFIIT